MNNIIWVLVANTSYAQIFEIRGMGKEIRRVYYWDNPDGRKKPSEINSDRPGRAFDRFGYGRHAMSNRVDVRGHQQETFAHSINHILKKDKDNNCFQELVVIAPAQFLGQLQGVFSEPLKKIVIKEIAKDLPSYLKEREVIDHLCKDLDLWNHVKAEVG